MKPNLARKIENEADATSVAALVVQGCAEGKGTQVVALSVSGVSDVADYFVIASGRSDRQVQGIVNKAIEMLDQRGIKPISIEGFDQGHWILVDFGDVVLHVFYEPMREHYNIEGLWSRGKKVDLLKKRRQISRKVALHAA